MFYIDSWTDKEYNLKQLKQSWTLSTYDNKGKTFSEYLYYSLIDTLRGVNDVKLFCVTDINKVLRSLENKLKKGE